MKSSRQHIGLAAYNVDNHCRDHKIPNAEAGDRITFYRAGHSSITIFCCDRNSERRAGLKPATPAHRAGCYATTPPARSVPTSTPRRINQHSPIHQGEPAADINMAPAKLHVLIETPFKPLSLSLKWLLVSCELSQRYFAGSSPLGATFERNKSLLEQLVTSLKAP